MADIPELKSVAELAAEVTEPKAKKADDFDPRDAVEYTFNFTHVDPRGKTWGGEFTNRILTPRMKIQYSVLKAKLSDNTPLTALEFGAYTLIDHIAHLAISLVKRPKWAGDLEEIHDEEIIHKLHQEAMAHEARFCRRSADPTESTSPG